MPIASMDVLFKCLFCLIVPVVLGEFLKDIVIVLPDRLMVGQRFLEPLIGVRIPIGQQKERSGYLRPKHMNCFICVRDSKTFSI